MSGSGYHVNAKGFVVLRDVGVIRRVGSVVYTAIGMIITVEICQVFLFRLKLHL